MILRKTGESRRLRSCSAPASRRTAYTDRLGRGIPYHELRRRAVLGVFLQKIGKRTESERPASHLPDGPKVLGVLQPLQKLLILLDVQYDRSRLAVTIDDLGLTFAHDSFSSISRFCQRENHPWDNQRHFRIPSLLFTHNFHSESTRVSGSGGRASGFREAQDPRLDCA